MKFYAVITAILVLFTPSSYAQSTLVVEPSSSSVEASQSQSVTPSVSDSVSESVGGSEASSSMSMSESVSASQSVDGGSQSPSMESSVSPSQNMESSSSQGTDFHLKMGFFRKKPYSPVEDTNLLRVTPSKYPGEKWDSPFDI